jgi:hypothetical protein
MLIFGALPKICFAGGMTTFLYERKIRIFDYRKFAGPFRNRIRENAGKMAVEAGIEIEFIGKRNFRKEDRVKEILAQRGEQPGLVCIFPAMEPCPAYKPWHNKQTGKTFLVPDDGQCLHYYFYFLDQDLGLCQVRVPTWLPCRLQVCCNGHNWLAGQLGKLGIEYRMADKAFPHIADWPQAQRISDGWQAKRIPARLDDLALRCCPIYKDFATGYHGSVDQCEYATDIVFRQQEFLQAIYENLVRTAIHTVKPDNIATFPGRKLNTRFEGEMGNRFNIRIGFNIRIEGTRIKHTMFAKQTPTVPVRYRTRRPETMGPVSLKLYDKFGLILRIETTVNDLTFFKHYREVEHRDGSGETKWASMPKTIYSLPALRELLEAAQRRYLEFLPAIDDRRTGRNKLEKLSQPVEQEGRRYSGFNLFDADDEKLLCSLVRGEFNISGLQNKTLRRHLPEFSGGQVSRLIKRLRTPRSYQKSRALIQVLRHNVR